MNRRLRERVAIVFATFSARRAIMRIRDARVIHQDIELANVRLDGRRCAEMVSIRALPVDRSVRSCQHVFPRQLRIRTRRKPEPLDQSQPACQPVPTGAILVQVPE